MQNLPSTPSGFSNTIEMFVTRELQHLINQHPTGVPLNILASSLSSYGISIAQVK